MPALVAVLPLAGTTWSPELRSLTCVMGWEASLASVAGSVKAYAFPSVPPCPISPWHLGSDLRCPFLPVPNWSLFPPVILNPLRVCGLPEPFRAASARLFSQMGKLRHRAGTELGSQLPFPQQWEGACVCLPRSSLSIGTSLSERGGSKSPSVFSNKRK